MLLCTIAYLYKKKRFVVNLFMNFAIYILLKLALTVVKDVFCDANCVKCNKQIQRIYVPRHYYLLFKWEKMTVNKLYLEINCEFNHSSIVLNQIPLFVRETFW